MIKVQAEDEINKIQQASVNKRTGIYNKLERINDRIASLELNKDTIVTEKFK
ncbi:hypothetical protein [Bacillus sp. 196mf]|uniref:hypothetical protein n=1 Tax=Bacillus sp. 196mf TaxID=1761754 RepID=UPI001C649812|nr:hypothetical protein [Bacillus sp. 196mf]